MLAISRRSPWNVVMVAQRGWLGYQALLCAASIRAHHTADDVRIFICAPNNTRLWSYDPTLNDADLVAAFARYGCELLSFDNADFGSKYPHSNKFYSILSLPADEPFIFLDSDTVIAHSMRDDRFDFANPVLKGGGSSWPKRERDTRSIAEIWRSLYRFFDIDPEPYFDAKHGDNAPQSFPYYAACLMYHESAGRFGSVMLEMARRLWLERPSALGGQKITPWLDQIVLPLVHARLGIPRINDRPRVPRSPLCYRFPGFLVLQAAPKSKVFDELSKDQELISVLTHDEGFRYYLSAEGRELVERTYADAVQCAPTESFGSSRNQIRELMRRRAPMLR